MNKLKYLPLINGELTLIDEEDYDLVKKYKWRKHKTGYVVTSIRKGRKVSHLRLHRFIMNTPTGSVCDHINGKKLDNRKENLRNVLFHENNFNRSFGGKSKYKGVQLKKNGKFEVKISFNKKRISLGRFVKEEEAAATYNKKALEFFGEFARLNPICSDCHCEIKEDEVRKNEICGVQPLCDPCYFERLF